SGQAEGVSMAERIGVKFEKFPLYVLADPVLPEDKQRILEGMRANGYPEGDEAALYFSDDRDRVAQDMASLGLNGEQMVEFWEDGSLVCLVDEWTFRHLCGYQSD